MLGGPDVNERKTEEIVRDGLRRSGYYSSSSIRVEEQKSDIEAVKRLLKTASKTGKGGTGSPEFIISSMDNTDFLLIVECKADSRDHESKSGSVPQPAKYAVDGVLHYAKFLSREYNVVAMAASGSTKATFRTSIFLQSKGAASPKPLISKFNKPVKSIIPWSDYVQNATFDPSVQRLRQEQLMAFAVELHDFMRDHAKLSESEKPLLVSGTLIALRDPAFAATFDKYSPADLQRAWQRVLGEQLNKADLPRAKKRDMTQPYSSIAVNPKLGEATEKFPKGVLCELIRMLHEKVWPFISTYQDFDVVGQFYGEFLKYAGGDQKLGIVLTPRHITDLFARLANVGKDSTVLDICAGTGGFLISAMARMNQEATTDAQRERIKKKGLIGVEDRADMYALAASNMILRGDGKANLYQGDCFNPTIAREVRKFRSDVGLLNPPYSQADKDQHELAFVKQALDCVRTGGTVIAILPMSCAISPHPLREALMRDHTLEAVMSLPSELFYPVGVIPCAMVWTAGKPHAESNLKTWFGYWRDDGFVKTKHRGRIDLNGRWEAIRDRWVETFRNREVHAGESVTRAVTPEDEWCAEAYMETDYSTLTQSEFEEEVKKYVVFRILNEGPDSAGGSHEETE
jgi:16S rRNA G966 N2-methylase RsmD